MKRVKKILSFFLVKCIILSNLQQFTYATDKPLNSNNNPSNYKKLSPEELEKKSKQKENQIKSKNASKKSLSFNRKKSKTTIEDSDFKVSKIKNIKEINNKNNFQTNIPETVRELLIKQIENNISELRTIFQKMTYDEKSTFVDQILNETDKKSKKDIEKLLRNKNVSKKIAQNGMFWLAQKLIERKRQKQLKVEFKEKTQHEIFGTCSSLSFLQKKQNTFFDIIFDQHSKMVKGFSIIDNKNIVVYSKSKEQTNNLWKEISNQEIIIPWKKIKKYNSIKKNIITSLITGKDSLDQDLKNSKITIQFQKKKTRNDDNLNFVVFHDDITLKMGFITGYQALQFIKNLPKQLKRKISGIKSEDIENAISSSKKTEKLKKRSVDTYDKYKKQTLEIIKNFLKTETIDQKKLFYNKHKNSPIKFNYKINNNETVKIIGIKNNEKIDYRSLYLLKKNYNQKGLLANSQVTGFKQKEDGKWVKYGNKLYTYSHNPPAEALKLIQQVLNMEDLDPNKLITISESERYQYRYKISDSEFISIIGHVENGRVRFHSIKKSINEYNSNGLIITSETTEFRPGENGEWKAYAGVVIKHEHDYATLALNIISKTFNIHNIEPTKLTVSSNPYTPWNFTYYINKNEYISILGIVENHVVNFYQLNRTINEYNDKGVIEKSYITEYQPLESDIWEIFAQHEEKNNL